MNSFIPINYFFPYPKGFKYSEYLDAMREFWMLFPEIDGRKVTTIIAGTSATIMAEVLHDDQSDLRLDEYYFFIPCEDGMVRLIRMEAIKKLSLDEYRLSVRSVMRVAQTMIPLYHLLEEMLKSVLGEELLEEMETMRFGEI